MEEDLWQINPYLIENIEYYVSIMPQAYRGELLEYTDIEPPLGSNFSYTEWKTYNFDNNFNLKEGRDWDSNEFTQMEKDTNNYYFLLFFFSAFKRSPEEVELVIVNEWIVRCLSEVWMQDPSITPYYTALRKWNFKSLSQDWEVAFDLDIVNPSIHADSTLRELFHHRDYDNLGLSQTGSCGLYPLFISPVFDLSRMDSLNSSSKNFIRASYIDEEMYYRNGKDLIGVGERKLDMSWKSFRRYWSQYSYLIPVGFLSRKDNSLRFMNYSLSSFEKIK